MLPRTVDVGAIALSSSIIPGTPTSPAWMMRLDPRSAATASGRISPWVSEITPTMVSEAGMRGFWMEKRLLLFQEQRCFLADRRREFLGELRQQPRQRHLEANMVVGDVHDAGRALTERADVEGNAIAGPGLLVNVDEAGI